MKNPLIVAREYLQLSQRDLANELGTSQQFIQRHEIGQSATLPNSIGDYYDRKISPGGRLNILADLISVSVGEYPGRGETSSISAASLADYIPPSYFPGSPKWNDLSRRTTNLYALWVRLERLQLPDVSRLCTIAKLDPRVRGQNRREVRRFFDELRVLLGVSGELDSAQQRYEVARLIHVHPFIISRFLDHPENCVDLPPTITVALNGTRK